MKTQKIFAPLRGNMSDTKTTMTIRKENMLLKEKGLKKCGMCLEVKEVGCFHMCKAKKGPASKCKNCHIAYLKMQRTLFPEKEKMYAKRWQERNPEKYKAHYNRTNKRFREENKSYYAEYMRNKLATDTIFSLRFRISSYIRCGLHKGQWSRKDIVEPILGCSVKELEKYVCVESYRSKGNDWHVDHAVPLKCAKTEPEVLALNHFSNIRITSKEENRAKRDKYIPKELYNKVLSLHPNRILLEKMVLDNAIIIT